MNVEFESHRFYVAGRRSVLFFARVADRRVRCYVGQDALIGSPRALRDERDMYQRSLIAFDEHRALVEATARDLILTGSGDLATALVISAAALAERREAPIAASRRAGVAMRARRRVTFERTSPLHEVSVGEGKVPRAD